MLPTERRPVPYEILGRIRAHFVGRVVTLAAATAFNAILSVALLPLATRHLEASDYGIYGLVISIVILVSAAADGGAGLLVRQCCHICRHRGERRGAPRDHPMALPPRPLFGSGRSACRHRAIGRPDADTRDHQHLRHDIFSNRPRARHRRTAGNPIPRDVPQHYCRPFRIRNGRHLTFHWCILRAVRRLGRRSRRPRTSPRIVITVPRLAPPRRRQLADYSSLRNRGRDPRLW